MDNQLNLDFTTKPYPFGGKTFNASLDGVRLTGHLQKVFDLMSDGNWRTLRQVAEAVGCTEASASARLRDLRKPWAGGHTVERRRVEGGLWQYRLLIL